MVLDSARDETRVHACNIAMADKGERRGREAIARTIIRWRLRNSRLCSKHFGRRWAAAAATPKRSRARLFTPHGIPEKRNRSLPRERAAPRRARSGRIAVSHNLCLVSRTHDRGASTHLLVLRVSRRDVTRLAYARIARAEARRGGLSAWLSSSFSFLADENWGRDYWTVYNVVAGITGKPKESRGYVPSRNYVKSASST